MVEVVSQSVSNLVRFAVLALALLKHRHSLGETPTWLIPPPDTKSKGFCLPQAHYNNADFAT